MAHTPKRQRSAEESNAGSLGDLMGGQCLDDVGERIPLDSFTPMQRVVLSANGNLQRLVSSYHDSPVSVSVKYSRSRGDGWYERLVTLSVFGIEFGVAISSIQLTSKECIEAVEKLGLAIGQLFRHLNILPHFELLCGAMVKDAEDFNRLLQDGHNAIPLSLCSRNGPEEPGCSASDFPDVPRFWRDYVLSGQGVICHIRELIRCDLFELADTRQPSGERPPDVGTLPTKCMPTHFGDIMNPRTTSISLPSGFTPTERLLLTANGNVERIVSSYYNMPVTLYVMLNHQRNPAVYDRQVAMMMNGKQFLLAKTTVYITDPQWLHAVEHERVPVGSLFRHMGVMPTFTLHTACRGIVRHITVLPQNRPNSASVPSSNAPLTLPLIMHPVTSYTLCHV